jgi:hypothetical protein
MNTNTTRSTVSIALTAVVVAAHPRNDRAPRASEPRAQQTSASIEISGSFARPLAALGGRSPRLSTLTDHHARKVVGHVV